GTTFELELPKASELKSLEPKPAVEASAHSGESVVNYSQTFSTGTADSNVRIGERVLTPQEIEERKAFEEQKRILEDRAERLRRMSFAFNRNDTEESENIPACLTRNNGDEPIDDAARPSLSSYRVDERTGEGNIGTVNTFLDG